MSNTSLVRNLFVSLILVSSNGSSANKWEGVQEMDVWTQRRVPRQAG